jgi:hypothetical protein
VGVVYFVRGTGASWAVIRLTGCDREDIVAEGLSRDAAEELCFSRLEELPRGPWRPASYRSPAILRHDADGRGN